METRDIQTDCYTRSDFVSDAFARAKIIYGGPDGAAFGLADILDLGFHPVAGPPPSRGNERRVFDLIQEAAMTNSTAHFEPDSRSTPMAHQFAITRQSPHRRPDRADLPRQHQRQGQPARPGTRLRAVSLSNTILDVRQGCVELWRVSAGLAAAAALAGGR